jgi:hypothetical protein
MVISGYTSAALAGADATIRNVANDAAIQLQIFLLIVCLVFVVRTRRRINGLFAGAIRPRGAGCDRRDDGVAHLRRAHARRARLCDVAGAVAVGQHLADGRLDAVGVGSLRERVAQHHAHRQNRRDRVGEVLAGDVRRRAVHRLV